MLFEHDECGKRWLRQISSLLKGPGVFVSEQQTNPNRLHTNPKCNVVKDSINGTYDTIERETTLNRTHDVNVPRKNPMKNYDKNI